MFLEQKKLIRALFNKIDSFESAYFINQRKCKVWNYKA